MKTLPLVFLCSVGCIGIEVELPRVCAGVDAVTIDNPLSGDLGEFSDEPIIVDAEVPQDGIEGIPDTLTTDVLFFDGALVPLDGSDLGFVEKVRIHLAPGVDDPDLPAVDLFSYRRDPTERDSDISISGSQTAVDLARYLASESAVFGFELEGAASEFPDQVVFDADLCFSVDAAFHQDLF